MAASQRATAAAEQAARRGYRLPSAAEILREPCPFCAASVGEPCSANVTGGKYPVMKGFHAKRMRLARYPTAKG